MTINATADRIRLRRRAFLLRARATLDRSGPPPATPGGSPPGPSGPPGPPGRRDRGPPGSSYGPVNAPGAPTAARPTEARPLAPPTDARPVGAAGYPGISP